MGRRWTLMLAAAVAAALALASLAWADRRSADRLPEGVTVGGVHVGGLTEEEALERVWSAVRANALRPVRVRVVGRTFTLSATQAGVRLRLPVAVRRAFDEARDGHMLERGWRALTGGSVSHHEPLTPTVSEEKVDAFVRRITRRVEREPRDARLTISVDRVSVTESRTGRRLVAAEQLRRRIRAALTTPGADRSLVAKVRSIAPATDEDDVLETTPGVVTVSRSQRRARLFVRGRLTRSFTVAVGDPKYPTPLGEFRVQTMQKDPAWNVPRSEWAGDLQGQTIPAGDPRNPLVARWIGFDGAVGFHGTESVTSLGQAASHGCVRMSRRDVIEIYEQVDIGTPVRVFA